MRYSKDKFNVNENKMYIGDISNMFYAEYFDNKIDDNIRVNNMKKGMWHFTYDTNNNKQLYLLCHTKTFADKSLNDCVRIIVEPIDICTGIMCIKIDDNMMPPKLSTNNIFYKNNAYIKVKPGTYRILLFSYNNKIVSIGFTYYK